MYTDLAEKRLLYLGGIKRASYVVQRAKKLGLYVVVADYDVNSPAKAVADEGVLIDATDVQALVKLCKEKHIDGILTGYVDFLMPVCYEISRITGIPYYATKEMIDVSTNKLQFKIVCNKYGVPVPQTYNVDVNDLEGSSRKLPYPVFIKPLDASGSRGANVCEKQSDFIQSYEYANSFSKNKTVTVEDYLCGTEFILDYILIDGEPQLLSMADRYATSDRSAAVNNCNLMLLPSKNLKRYCETVNEKVVNMYKKEGYRDGIMFLQGYAGDKITFYETGCRLGGTWPFVDEYFTGINPMDLLFHYAVNGSMLPKGETVRVSPFFEGKSAIIYFLCNRTEGRIATVSGVEELKSMPEVVSILQYYGAGDEIAANRLNDVLLLAVHLVSSDFTKLKKTVNYVYSLVKMNDELGNSMIAPVYDIDAINEKDYE